MINSNLEKNLWIRRTAWLRKQFRLQYWPGFDIKGYYYCLALISLSDYRKEDCEKQLWTTIDQFLKNDPGLENIPTLQRNMKVLGSQRAVLKDMRVRIEEEISKRKTK